MTAYGAPYPYVGSKQTSQPEPFPALVDLAVNEINRKYSSKHKISSSLVNRYSGPGSYLPEHSDNEGVIIPGSDIYIISLGQSRTVIFKNVETGEERSLFVKHGSIYKMSASSQKLWKHRIDKDDNFTGIRISLTFFCVKHPELNNTTPSQHPQHLIFGDSLMRNISTNENSSTIFKGGAKIKDMELLVEKELSTLNMSKNDLNLVKSVSISVGTNNLTDRKPLYKIFNEYAEFIEYLSIKFPRARIGLFNVPPRFYPDIGLLIRIRAFNNFLLDLASFYKDVNVIQLYWEFIDPRGYMNPHFYKHDFLHFSEAGVAMVKDYISSFQHT